MPISPRNALRLRATRAAAASALLLAGCGGGSPFGSASNRDLVFVSAAQTWDINKDNVVGCDEWTRYAGDLFQSADQDRDGAVTAEEYARITRQDKLFESAGFSYFDANGDGSLTLAEFAEKPNPAFVLLDKDKNCQLDGNEMVQTRPAAAKAKETYGEAPDPRTGR